MIGGMVLGILFTLGVVGLFWLGYFVGVREREDRYDSYKTDLRAEVMGWHNRMAHKVDETAHRVLGLEGTIGRLNLPNEYWSEAKPLPDDGKTITLDCGDQLGGVMP